MSILDNDMADRLQAERLAVETFYRSFNEGNPDLVDDAVTADWCDLPPAPGQGRGPGGFKPIIRSVISAFPDIHVAIQELVQEPGRIAVRAEMSGTHRGDLFGIAPTGRAVCFRIHEFHRLNGHRVTRTWHLEDWFGVFQQIGRFPKLQS